MVNAPTLNNPITSLHQIKSCIINCEMHSSADHQCQFHGPMESKWLIMISGLRRRKSIDTMYVHFKLHTTEPC